MSGNFAIKGGGVGRLMANAILNFHFDFLTPSLILADEYANLKLVDVVPCRESFCDIENKIKKDKKVSNCWVLNTIFRHAWAVAMLPLFFLISFGTFRTILASPAPFSRDLPIVINFFQRFPFIKRATNCDRKCRQQKF